MFSLSNNQREEWQEGLVLALTIPLIAVLAFLAFGCFRLFTVPSASMLPTYPVGTYILASRLETGFSRYTFDLFALPLAHRWPHYDVRRGDVVVFRHPSHHDVFYVKRIIGLPGDTVAMAQGRLILNGTPVPRERGLSVVVDHAGEKTTATAYTETLPEGASHQIIETSEDTGPLDNTQLFKVPLDHIFVMGDNRDNSNDSRMDIGFVPMDLINGKVVATIP